MNTMLPMFLGHLIVLNGGGYTAEDGYYTPTYTFVSSAWLVEDQADRALPAGDAGWARASAWPRT